MEVQNKKLKKETKNIGKNFKDWKSYYDKYQKLFKDSNALTEDQKRANASSKYIEQINDGNPKTLEQWKDLFLLQEEIATRKKFPALIDPDTDELIDTAFNSIEKLADKKAYEAYTKQMSDMTTASREAAIEAAKLHATETEVFGHDYIKDFLDGITNIGSAIALVCLLANRTMKILQKLDEALMLFLKALKMQQKISKILLIVMKVKLL